MQEDKNAIYQMRFPQKLWYLLNLRTDAILWGATGRTILLNYRILHSYLQCDHSVFKTTNISSFVRQLNLYGFRKVTSHLQDPLCNSSNPYMHEYVHDYFQFGRPELLNKITRKALTMRKNLKPKNLLYGSTEPLLYFTPLQKARRALRLALKKAAQDLFMETSPNQMCNYKFDCEEAVEDFCEDDESDYDWLLLKNNYKEDKNIKEGTSTTENIAPINEEKHVSVDNQKYKGVNSHNLMDFKDEPCEQNNDTFPNNFLSMPDLDAEPNDENPAVELLAEFDIKNDLDQGIARKLGDNDHISLNCVLPSINSDQNDYGSISEKNNDLDHYHGEWDQMFSDIITNKGPNQDSSSDLKELYSQISRTIDVLNP